jgi:hypothetical protein
MRLLLDTRKRIAEPARLYTTDAMLAPYSELVTVIRNTG